MGANTIIVVAIVCFCLLAAFKHYLRSGRGGISAADRRLVEGLRADAARLEQRVDALERALLDAEAGTQAGAGYTRQRTEV